MTYQVSVPEVASQARLAVSTATLVEDDVEMQKRLRLLGESVEQDDLMVALGMLTAGHAQVTAASGAPGTAEWVQRVLASAPSARAAIFTLWYGSRILNPRVSIDQWYAVTACLSQTHGDIGLALDRYTEFRDRVAAGESIASLVLSMSAVRWFELGAPGIHRTSFEVRCGELDSRHPARTARDSVR